MTNRSWFAFTIAGIAAFGVTKNVNADVLHTKSVDARVALDAAVVTLDNAKKDRNTAKERVDATCLGLSDVSRVSVKPAVWRDWLCPEAQRSDIETILKKWTSPSDATMTDPSVVLESAKLDAAAAAIKPAAANETVEQLKADVGKLTPEVRALIIAVCSVPATPDKKWATECAGTIESLAKCEAAKVKEPWAEFVKKDEAVTAQSKIVDTRRKDLDLALDEENAVGAENYRTLESRLARVRKARCMTAYCFGGPDGRRYGIEPILDLPIGMFWGVGQGALAGYINSNNIKIQFTAGLRYWFAGDTMSVGVLLAQPDLTSAAQDTVEFRERSIPASQIRRPYPTVVLGVWGDILQLSLSYDTLRNAKSSDTANYIPEFAPNSVLARTITIGLAISPLTAARNGIAASVVEPDKKGVTP